MLDRTQHISLATNERRRIGDYLRPIAFFGVAAVAMIAWIAAISWASWSLITWITQ